MNQTHTYTLRVLTPVHIGDGEVLYKNVNFVIYEGTVYVLDEHKLTEALQSQHLLKDFSNEFMEKGRNFSLASFLSKVNLHHKSFYASIAQYTIPLDRARNTTGQSNELRTFIKAHTHRPYIPGSSIKGALRIGVIYTLLKNSPEITQTLLVDRVVRQLNRLNTLPRNQQFEQRSRLRRNLGKDLDVLLNSFQLPRGKRGPNTDLLRVWEIPDTPELPIESLTMLEVTVLKTNGAVSTRLTVEALKPGTTIPVTISINRTLYEWFAAHNPQIHIRIPRGRNQDPIHVGTIPFREYEELILNPLKGSQMLIHDLLEAEKQNLKAPNFRNALPDQGSPNLRLGWGQGLLSTTVFLLLPEELRKRVRNELFRNRGNQPAPRTRKLTSQNQLMGFCRLEAHEA